MKLHIASTVLSIGLGLISGPYITISGAADDAQSAADQLTPKFPKSDKCSTSSPCKDVVGEIVRIEENYWIKMPNGNETHMRVTPDTKLESRVKVGDPIAAQLTSRGDADAIKKLQEMPRPDELTIPKKTKEVEVPTTLKDLR